MSTRTACLALLWACLLLSSGFETLAQVPTSEDINHSRGLSVSSAYQLDDLDAVNLFSGNLTVSLPLSQTYPVNHLEYGFSLHTNSNVWDFDRVNRGDGVFETVAEPDSEISNAGLGWTFSMGRLYPPNTPGINDNPSTWLLIESDGSRRKFSSSLHAWGSSATTTFSYTRDGSFLRMRKLATGEREVESPDGAIRVFRTDGRLRQIRDPYGNPLDISYDLSFLTWTMSDSTGRTHIASFEADPTDPEPIIANKRKRLKTLDLAAFGGSRAVYTFSYSRVFIDRPSKDSSSTTGPQVEVSLLDSLTLPDGSSWQMTYIETTADKRNVFEETGAIRSLTLPTLGKYEWEYSLFTFPEQQPGGVEEGPNPWQTGTGVRFKRAFLRSGGLHGTWEYQQGARPPTQTATFDARETRTWVTDPLGHQTVNYFQNDPASFGYGLPFTTLLVDGNRFLSREIFDGTATASSRRRSGYLRYESDDGVSNGNARVASEKTIFHDDANRWLTVDRSDFDGFGHYRTQVRQDSFASVPPRTRTTSFNPARGTFGTASFSPWPTSSAWVLGTFTDRTVTEGTTTAKEQFCFESHTGFLLRHRLYRGASPTSTDVLTVFTRNPAGVPVLEQSYGGDLQILSTSSNLCGLGLPSTDQYRIEHGYQHGARRSTRFLTSGGASLGFYTLDQDHDRNTALPVTSRDIAGLITDYEYDTLGRRTWIKPRATGGVDRDGWVEFVYVPVDAVNRARVEVRQRGTGAKTRPVLAKGRTMFDDFGRMAEERTTLAVGGESRRTINYNALGQRTQASERTQVGGTLHHTRFNDYDPFGRPRQIVAPDGKTVSLTYFGIRRQDRTITLGTSYNATTGAVNESSVIQRHIFNRRGQLMKVTEDPASTNHVTDYLYDIGDRLSRVTQLRSGVTQVRRFTYDNRGFLISEQHPEKGSFGNGLVQYLSYDPLGHASRKIDGPNDLTFTYDRAGRITRIRDTLGLQRVQKDFTYAPGSGFSDKRAGKLISATRHNYFDDFNVDLAVTESYTYAGREGRVSTKGTSVSSGDSYTQGFTWNELGDLQSLTYPDCLHCPAGVEPARSVSYSYSNGFLTSIPGWASSITYHPNGMIDRITHANGVTWTQGRDPDDMRRPASITVARSGVTYLAPGVYQYDGSGNVVKIGSNHFLYDRLGRLTEGTLWQAGNNHEQTFGYDGFSNLTSITTWTNGSPSTRTMAANLGTNRLSAAGYDAAGAVTSWGSFSYERDSLEMIRKLTGGGLNLRYAYTADDERFLEFDVSTFKSVWRLRDLEGQVIREIHLNNGTGIWSWQKDWIRQEGQPLAAVDTVEGTRHLHPDHLGTTRAITDASGSHRSTYHFDPYGELAASFTAGSEVLLYTGHERDDHALTGGSSGTTDDLDYMHARYYNPLLGRFLRVDAVRQVTGTPISANRYAYVLNNPVRLVDPFGLFPCPGLEGVECHDEITVVGYIDDANQELQDILTLFRLASAEGRLGRTQPVRVELGLFDRALSAVPSNGVEYGRCVRENRLEPLAALAALGSAIPKRLVPPFRVPRPNRPLTTPLRVVGHQLKRAFPTSAAARNAAVGLRGAGRAVSRVATPLTIGEGFYDIGVLGYCALKE